jgi:hypothetical protein
MLTTLFKYESLRGRPNPAKCAVIVVVKSTSETMNSKAAALRVMLDNGFLTNVALSADLAHAVVSESAG